MSGKKYPVIMEREKDIGLGWVDEKDVEKVKEFIQSLDDERTKADWEEAKKAEALVDCFVRKTEGPFKGTYAWSYKVGLPGKGEGELENSVYCGCVVGADENGNEVKNQYYRAKNLEKMFGKGDSVVVDEGDLGSWVGIVQGYKCDKEGTLKVNVRVGLGAKYEDVKMEKEIVVDPEWVKVKDECEECERAVMTAEKLERSEGDYRVGDLIAYKIYMGGAADNFEQRYGIISEVSELGDKSIRFILLREWDREKDKECTFAYSEGKVGKGLTLPCENRKKFEYVVNYSDVMKDIKVLFNVGKPVFWRYQNERVEGKYDEGVLKEKATCVERATYVERVGVKCGKCEVTMRRPGDRVSFDCEAEFVENICC